MAVTCTARRAYNFVDAVFLVMTVSLASKASSWFWNMEFYFKHKTTNLDLLGKMASIESDAVHVCMLYSIQVNDTLAFKLCSFILSQIKGFFAVENTL